MMGIARHKEGGLPSYRLFLFIHSKPYYDATERFMLFLPWRAQRAHCTALLDGHRMDRPDLYE